MAQSHEMILYREDADGVEQDFVCVYNVTPYDPGITSGPPERCYPPEGGEVEIETVNGMPFDPDVPGWNTFEEEIRQRHDPDVVEPYDNSDDRYEQRRDERMEERYNDDDRQDLAA